MNDGGDCRTAPATPGLLNIDEINFAENSTLCSLTKLKGRALSDSVCPGVAVNDEWFSSLTKMFNCHRNTRLTGASKTLLEF